MNVYTKLVFRLQSNGRRLLQQQQNNLPVPLV
jgi:hypothetical protein